ncbi:hypothetical protein GGF46_000759 [Coemansia sp. RSA 552]|nr:hypothetical protein GGF46_000759 [Coemansia sp. RSA 552]
MEGAGGPVPGIEAAATISIEQLRATFGNGSPTTVYEALVPFLRQESRSNGDTRVINEIAESVGKLVYPWFQNSEAMRGDEQRSLYELLRPDGRLIDTLLQYHMLQRQQQRGVVSAAGGAGGGVPSMMLELASLPVEYHAAQNTDVSRTMNLPAEFTRRAVAGGEGRQAAAATTGFHVDALEYVLYHLSKALVPPRENSVQPGSGGTVYRGRAAAGSGAAALVALAQCLAREYIGFFLPVAVPERAPLGRTETGVDRSPIKHIRERLHDLAGADHSSSSGTTGRRTGNIDTDLLDVCEYGQALELASFFSACTVLLWLPVVPMDVLAAVRGSKHAGRTATTPATQRPSSKESEWMWIPSGPQLAALHLFHLVVGHVARGERQMERYHMAGGAIDQDGPSGLDQEAHSRRIGLSGTVRDTLRSRCLNAAVGDTLGLVLGSCGRPGFTDSEIWIPLLDVTAHIWIRYAMPWRGTRGGEARAPSNGAELSALWQARIPLMMKGLEPALYGPALALFVRQLASPHVDLLAHTARGISTHGRGGHGHGVHEWLHDAVNSVFGHPLNMDVLAVIERVLTAFATPAELRAILAAVERCRQDAYPRQVSTPVQTPTGTPTRVAGVRPMPLPLPFTEAEQPLQADFAQLVEAARAHLAPYARELATYRSSGSTMLDAALGRPPVAAVFSGSSSAQSLLRTAVGALHSTEVLAERQLRLIAPPCSADQARSAVADIFLVLRRLFSVDDSAAGTVSGRGTAESMQARAQALRDAQAHDPGTPEMARGSLTPRGRWELKTGRKKFTSQSLDSSGLAPRGPRALLSARSYENQWLLDHALTFNVWANRRYQQALDAIEAAAYPIPSAARTLRLDFRWAAAYPNIRFVLLVLLALRIVSWLLF